jgi:polysaccharide biosynthesis/export protein
MQRTYVLVLVAALVTGCAGSGKPRETFRAEAPTEKPSRWAVPPPPAISREPAAAQGDYRLAPKDRLRIQVHGQNELTRELRVSEAGTVTVPLLGELQVAGLSAAETEGRIAAGLKGRYLVNPRVSVSILEYAGRQVQVMGAVRQPGAYPLRTNATTVLAALADAHGVHENADRVAYVMRGQPRAGEPQPVVVDLDALLRQGDNRYNVTVEAGDTLFVPQSNVYYVAGEVEKRGAFQLRRGTTVAKALTEAGGVTKRAATGSIKVIRTLPNGEKTEIGDLDLTGVLAGDPKQDVALEPQDIVVVPESGAKTAAYGFLNLLKTVLRFSLIAL